MSRDKLISVKQASMMLGVSAWSLRRYPVEILKPVYTPKGHRRYRLSDIEKLQGIEDKTTCDNVAIYVRVSSQDQKASNLSSTKSLRSAVG